MRMTLYTTALLILGSWGATAPAQTPTAPPAAPKPPVAKTAAAPHPEPGWLGVVIARGELREQIEATPILDRPYRPLHFYQVLCT